MKPRKKVKKEKGRLKTKRMKEINRERWWTKKQ
jgi:hypothetical protein